MKSTERNDTSNQEMVTISRAEYEKLQAQGKRISELESRVEILMDALRLERHRQFGASSEKMSEDAMDQLSFLFNEAEVYSDVVKAQEEATPVVAHKRHKKHEYTLDNIPEGMTTYQIHHRLEGFKGYLHTDGYAGYHTLSEEITVVGCWAHLRRKFDEAMKSLPKGKAKKSLAAQGEAFCSLLFQLEDGFVGITSEERYKERRKQSKPVLDALLSWANSRKVTPHSALGKAMEYLNNQLPYLTNYLKDGRLEISNNRAERSIKPFVISRKNFPFTNTPSGATGSAVIFTMIQTAIENHLDPYRYLTWLLKSANGADMDNPDIVQSLLPWNAPEECKA